MAMIVVTVVAMLGAGYLQVTSALARRQFNAIDNQLAFYLAEAGLAESFQPVRMGRSVQIGSETDPAMFGQGLLWVDVLELADGNVRLDSTGLVGSGRATLSFVLEPVEFDLGFFGDEDLIVDNVFLTDGWDPAAGSYTEQVGLETIEIDKSYPFLHVMKEDNILFYEGTFYRYVGPEKGSVQYDASVPYASLVGMSGSSNYGLDPGDFTDADWKEDYVPGRSDAWALAGNDDDDYEGPLVCEIDFVRAYFAGLDANPPPAEEGGDSGPESELGVTTGQGALLGSNGDVHFTLPTGEVAEIWGDVRPGPDGSVTGLDSVTIDGATGSRATQVELPVVTVPEVTMSAAVRHDDLLPMLIPQGESGHTRIEVAAGAELVIRGPATVVIGELVLEPGAHLELDTRAGEVALFVTDELDLQGGSTVATSGVEPDETTVQVSSTANDPLNPAVTLDATSQFYGTVYAPDTDVRIGSNFEIFGGVIARRLDISAGARLHFDSSGGDGRNRPRIIGWRVIEVPAAARRRGDPFRLLGVDPTNAAVLADAHDLGNVTMDLDYIDLAGVERSYVGSEDLFNWDDVESVVKVEREALRPKEVPDDAPPADEPPAEPEEEVRPGVLDAIASMDESDLRDFLLANLPLSDAELEAALATDKLGTLHTALVLGGSSPLSVEMLRTAATGTTQLDATGLGALLLLNSPLPEDVLQSVADDDGTLVTDFFKTKILGAN